MAGTSIFLCSLFVVLSMSASLFKDVPDVKISTNHSSPTALKISSEQDRFIVGFKDGSVRVFSMTGTEISQYSGHSSQIIDIEWIPKNGPVTLDASGKAIKWGSNGSALYTWTFNDSKVTDMTSTISFNDIYIAFNLGNRAEEYDYVIPTNPDKRGNYTAEKNATFERIVYDRNYSNLYVSENTNLVERYSTFSGSKWLSNFTTSSPAADFTSLSNSYLAMLTKDSKVYVWFTMIPSSYTPLYASSEITSCPSTNLIVTAASTTGTMEVYSYSTTKTQELSYMLSPVKALDCSTKYLVTYDESGHLAINGYTTPDPIPPIPVPDEVKLAVGILVAIIIGGVILIVAAIIICWCFCCRRRRQIVLQANYQKVNEQNQPQEKKKGFNVGFSY